MPGVERPAGESSPQRNVGAPASSSRGCLSSLQSLNNRIKNGKIFLNDAIDGLFYRYAKFAYDHSLVLIVVPVIITIGLTYFVLNRQPVVLAEDLYARTSSQAQDDRVAFTSAFGEQPPRRSLFLVVREDGGNILEPSILESLRTLDSVIRNEWVGTDGSKWEDICAKDGFGDCVVQSVLEMFTTDASLSQPSGEIAFPLHNSMRDNKLRTYRTDLLLSKTRLSIGNKVLSAQGLAFRYLGSGDKEKLNATLEWEAHLLKKVLSTTIVNCDITVQAKRSLDNELASSTTLDMADYIRFGAAGLVLAVYAMIVSFSTDLRQSKSLPALVGVIAALLGYVAGTALCHAAGLHHVPPAETSIFLVLGIGVDDMFVILNSYGLAFQVKDAKERVAVAMRDCGLAITVTTLTNLIAFGIGALSPYRAISNFCIITLAGLFMGYISCMTVFLAYLSIDARREHRVSDTKNDIEQHATPSPKNPVSTFDLVASQLEKQENRLALLRTAPTSETPSLFEKLTTSDIIETSPNAERPGLDINAVKKVREHSSVETLGLRTACEEGEFETKGNVGEAWRWFFKRYFGPAIVTPLGKIVIIIAFMGYLASAIWACSNLERGLNLVELTPYESYLRKFFDTAPRFFGGYGDEVDLFYTSEGTAWWEKDTAEQFVAWSDNVSQASYCSGGIADGMAAFYRHSYLPSLASGLLDSEDVFLSSLKIFLQEPMFQQFAGDFVFEGIGEDHRLAAFRTRFFTPYPHTSADLASYLTALRADIKSEIGEGFGARGFTWMFLFTETDLTILSETFSNLAYCFVAVLLVSMFLIVNARAPALVMAIILMIDVGIFGFMHLWGMDLNMLTMVTLIMSIGFSVDYTTHVVHTFSHCKGKTRSHRVVETLMLMGAPILHGAVSTQLMLFLILTINSFIFVIFFRMMTLVISISFLHGLILLPVVLSFVGPMESHDTAKNPPRATYFPSPLLQSIVNEDHRLTAEEAETMTQTETMTPHSPVAISTSDNPSAEQLYMTSEAAACQPFPVDAEMPVCGTEVTLRISLPEALMSPLSGCGSEFQLPTIRRATHGGVFQQYMFENETLLRNPRRPSEEPF